MAKLTSFKVDAKAIEEGEWIRPGEEYEDLEFRTRGFTDAYEDARAAKTRRAAARFGGDASKIPQSERRAILIDCLLAHVLLDVRGLNDEHDQPIPFNVLAGHLHDASFAPLVSAALTAAAQISNRRAADVSDAAKN